MRHLLFVRHSLPRMEENLDRRYWRLSDDGAKRAGLLADRVASYDVRSLVASDEIKSIETANVISSRVGVPFEIDGRLHEHSISNEPFLQEPAFKRLVHNFFENQDDVVFGEESATQCLSRVTEAIGDARKKYRGGDTVIVGHGRAFSLFLAKYLQMDPFELWKRLKAPAMIALEIPGLEPAETIFSVEDLI